MTKITLEGVGKVTVDSKAAPSKEAKILDEEIQRYRKAELENKNRLKNPWFRAWRDSLLMAYDFVEKIARLQAELE